MQRGGFTDEQDVHTPYHDEPPGSTLIEQDADVQYLLRGGPLHGSVVCIAADLTREQSQVRIGFGDAEHVYVGGTLGDHLDHLIDARHLGHAWRPVRWIEREGQTYVYSDDRPVLAEGRR